MSRKKAKFSIKVCHLYESSGSVECFKAQPTHLIDCFYIISIREKLILIQNKKTLYMWMIEELNIRIPVALDERFITGVEHLLFSKNSGPVT